METILTRIVRDKHQWLQQRQQQQPLSSFIDAITENDRDFYQALRNDKTVFILECKKASPSKGLLREEFDPALIASHYQPYASAISVLTDEPYFQGDYRYLSEVSQTVYQPVLCKDFIIDPYQIYLARYYRANAILLILAILTDEQYQHLAAVAHQLKLGILTEVSNQQELERALKLGAKVIGINNRNLHDFTIDINRSKELARQIADPSITVISESGIHTYQQVRELSPYVNGFLVGSALMAESDVAYATKKLIFGRHKICGLTSVGDAQAAYDAGAVYGGLIFAADSARVVTEQQAKSLVKQVPLRWVGVFRDESLATIISLAQQLSLTAIQLHRSEETEQLALLRQSLPAGCQIWQAIDMATGQPKLNKPFIDRYVLDNGTGGSGQSFDWQKLKGLSTDNAILAGGLNQNNITQALDFNCYAFDFNSGLEAYAGCKDHQKIRALFQLLQRNYRLARLEQNRIIP